VIRLFVTGTGTGVGKTVVARAIARALVRRGATVAAVKPVESGAPERAGALAPEDAVALARAAGRGSEGVPACLYALPDPVSPHLAAARAGVTISAGAILEMLESSEEGVDAVIAEGAGGLLVPLADDLLLADAIARAPYRLLIVAPNALGSINATLLTVEAARRRGIDVAGVVLDRTAPPGLGNAEAIAAFGRVPVIGEFPDAPVDDDDALAALAEEHLDIDALG